MPMIIGEIRRYLRDRGARFVLSSDSHTRQSIRYGFEGLERLCRGEGFALMDELDWRHVS